MPTQPTHMDVELHILPLAKPCEFIAVREEPQKVIEMMMTRSLPRPTAIPRSPKPQGWDCLGTVLSPSWDLPRMKAAHEGPGHLSLGSCRSQISLERRDSSLT